MKILARHKWVDGAVITESAGDYGIRRFTATIRGWKNWKIYEGTSWNVKEIIKTVQSIRDRIDAGDDSVFN